MTNLIFIDCHDLGRHLGCYGWQSVPSDNLDHLASIGVRFSNEFCNAPQCSPSRAALYTGRYPHANGMMGLAHPPFSWGIHDDEKHLAQYLKDAGYETAQFGTQHVAQQNEAAVKALGFDRVGITKDADVAAERAVDYLQNAPSQPFFLNIGFDEPHRDEKGDFLQAPADDSRGVDLPPYIPDIPEARAEFARLQGVIGKMDRAVGKIWSTVVEQDLAGDTWLIFTTDHGLAMPRAKCTMYDPGIETSLIMVGQPFGLTGGRVIDDLLSHVDILPTVLDMLGISYPSNIHGRSFRGRLQNTDYQPNEYIFAEKTFHTDYEPQRAIRSTRYKLIWNAEVDIINVAGDIMHSPIYPHMIDELTVERPPFEFYDLQADQQERNNLIDNAEHAAIVQEMRQQLLTWMQETNDPLLNGPVSSPYYSRAIALLNGDNV